jgi:hypothetical protein
MKPCWGETTALPEKRIRQRFYVGLAAGARGEAARLHDAKAIFPGLAPCAGPAGRLAVAAHRIIEGSRARKGAKEDARKEVTAGARQKGGARVGPAPFFHVRCHPSATTDTARRWARPRMVGIGASHLELFDIREYCPWIPVDCACGDVSLHSVHAAAWAVGTLSACRKAAYRATARPGPEVAALGGHSLPYSPPAPAPDGDQMPRLTHPHGAPDAGR